MSSLRIPTATYRLQFNQGFRFEDARTLVSYLHRLGITDLYASPILKARKGSTHGYDVTDPSRLNPELGTEEEFEALVQELRGYGMGLLLDIVPNHMAASPENPWWADVLENGQDSPYAAFFDINWNPPDSALKNKSWETTGKQINYRRFFDISDLIGVRVEDPMVFEATHALVFRLVREGKVTGLRIDHVDGLYDPLQYLSRLQRQIMPEERTGRLHSFYTVVEKILSGDEVLPQEWPVSGTTGYDFLNVVNTLFVDGGGVRAIDASYSRFIGAQVTFGDVVYEKKKQIMKELFAGEVKALGHQLACLAQQAGHTPTPSLEQLTKALVEVTTCLPIYRTYVRTPKVSPREQQYLEHTTQEAQRRNPALEATALDFLRRVLAMDFPTAFSSERKKAWLHFVLCWQQWTGAVMAKGLEDTALYNYNRLTSLNEVGGDAGHAGLSIDEFHRYNRSRQAHFPYTLNATSTHDTKRSEDVRARINVLSEIPEEWERRLTRWSRWNQPKKRRVNGLPVPEPNAEVLLYQTLAGAWPLSQEEVPEFKQRLKSYMVKAAREAKVFTSWRWPNPEYEEALLEFIESILEISDQNEFLPDFLQFEKQIAYYGFLNSLVQVLLKTTSPGVPDFYQGTELWNLSLVDPDNRRPVDFQRRRKLLDDLIQQEAQGQQSLIRQVLQSWEDGRVKLYLTCKALNVRKSHIELFLDGDYIPLQVEGKRQEHICAFGRRKTEIWALVVVPRFLTRLIRADTLPLGRRVWGDDFLILPADAPQRWLNVLTGETIKFSKATETLPLPRVFGIFPVALLVGTS
jgi:(1->4)-alpha-D-glucan 1-alpha-D-glucosylmutase